MLNEKSAHAEDLDPVLSEKQYCKYVGIGPATAQRHRAKGDGPRYIQLSARRIAYRLSDIQDWLNKKTRGEASASTVAKVDS